MVVRPQSGGAVVLAAGFQRSLMKGTHGGPVFGGEGKVHLPTHRFAATDPELWFCPGAKAGVTVTAGLLGGNFKHQIVSQRRQDLQVTTLGVHEVRNRNADVVQHDNPPSLILSLARAYQTRRSSISFFSSAMAFAGLRFFGQALAQFRIVWHRYSRNGSSRLSSRSPVASSRLSTTQR